MLKYDPYVIERIKELKGSRFNFENKIWITDLENKESLDTLFSNKVYEYMVSKDTKE